MSSAVTVVVALLGTAACSGGGYVATTVPTPTTTAAAAGPAKPARACAPGTTAVQSYAPAAAGGAEKVVLPSSSDGVLRVGVSADSSLLGARDPRTAQIEGFDIDVARAVAKAALGSEDRLKLVVISASERIPLLQKRQLDMVARNMSMTCDRWADIDFSAEYYQARGKLLVPQGQKASFDSLRGRRVCAPSGTTTLDYVRRHPGVTAVGARDHTSCLVLFRASQVDAIAGDDAVLAGLAAQDPYADVPTAQPSDSTVEHYGLGFPRDEKPSTKSADFVRFVNRLLDQMKADGRWKALYDKWFAASLGPAPAPPPSVYGRS